MVKHVILWQFKDELGENEKAQLALEIREQLEALRGVIPGLLKIRVQTEKLESSNADFMLDCTLEDEAALKAYAVHPEHVAVAKRLILPNIKTRVCIDYELSGDEN